MKMAEPPHERGALSFVRLYKYRKFVKTQALLLAEAENFLVEHLVCPARVTCISIHGNCSV